jgi:hypothetical protein
MDWSNVKARQMPEIMALLDMDTTDAVDLLDRDINLISILTGQSLDAVSAMSGAEFAQLRTRAYELLSTEPKAAYNPRIKLGKHTFYFHPNVSDTSVNELAELHLLNVTKDNYWSKVPHIIAVFAQERKWFKRWRKSLSHTEKAELFKDLPADTANGITLFFCRVSPILERAILNSLDNRIKENLNSLNQTLSELRSRNGDGIKSSTNSRTGTSRKNRTTSK